MQNMTTYDFRGFRLLKANYSRIKDKPFNSFSLYVQKGIYSEETKIYENIKNNVPGAMENYIKMLKAGGSDYPIEIVKLAGVDLSTKEPFLAVVNRLSDLVDQLEKYIEE